MLTSGSYSFKGGGDLSLCNFPIYHHFDPFWGKFNFFANGSIGYSKIKKDLDVGFEHPDHMEYQTVPMRFGGGICYLNRYDISILGGANIIYSYIKNIYDYNSEETMNLIKPIFDQAFANQSSKAYTYEAFWKIGYYPKWNEWKPYCEFINNYFQSTAKVNLNTISDFKSTSAGAIMKIGFETPNFIHLNKMDISTEFYIAHNTFDGDVRDTLGFEEYLSTAMLIHLYFNDILPLLNRIDFMIEKSKGGGLDGYNIGIGTGFTF